MKKLKWADNIGTKGWTSITGLFDIEDLKWLKEMHPDGDISPCFYDSRLSVYRYPKLEELTEVLENGPRIFYFNFPEDDKGRVLLIALKLKGMGERML